jgi:hypothetical protein
VICDGKVLDGIAEAASMNKPSEDRKASSPVIRTRHPVGLEVTLDGFHTSQRGEF